LLAPGRSCCKSAGPCHLYCQPCHQVGTGFWISFS